MRALYRPAARDDLEQIYDVTSEIWGTAQAQRYVSQLRSAVERVLRFPRSGQVYRLAGKEYRSASDNIDQLLLLILRQLINGLDHIRKKSCLSILSYEMTRAAATDRPVGDLTSLRKQRSRCADYRPVSSAPQIEVSPAPE